MCMRLLIVAIIHKYETLELSKHHKPRDIDPYLKCFYPPQRALLVEVSNSLGKRSNTQRNA